MRGTIDRFGRLVVPKEMRDRHGIGPGSEIEIEDTGSAIVLRPREELPGLVEKEGILVFRGRVTGEIEGAVKGQRGERLAKVWAART